MINKGLMVLGGALLFTGCGGSGTTAIETGVGYYEDSAVSGVSYVCGSKEGLTGENGSFTFEKGKGCTFSINDIKLREVLANGLTEGVKIKETKLQVARFLQSLDADGKPENGITVRADVITALAANNITTLPSTDAQVQSMVNILQDVNGYDGSAKSMEEASQHLAGFFPSITSSKNKIFVDESVTFTAVIDGNDGNDEGFSYSWELDGKTYSENPLVLDNLAAKNYYLELSVQKGDITLQTSTTLEVVERDNFSIAISGVKSNYNLNEHVTLSADVTGTDSIITYEWKDKSLKWKDDKSAGKLIANEDIGENAQQLSQTFRVGHHTITATAIVGGIEKNASVSFDVSNWTDFNRTRISGDRVLIHKGLMWVDETNTSKGACAKIHQDTDTNSTIFATEFESAKNFCSTLDGKFTNLTGWRIPKAGELKTFIIDAIAANTIPFYDAGCKKVLAYTGSNPELNTSYSTVTTRYGGTAGTVSADGVLIPNIGLRCVRDN